MKYNAVDDITQGKGKANYGKSRYNEKITKECQELNMAETKVMNQNVKNRLLMAFKLKPPFESNSPIYERELEEGVLGKGNKNGTILVAPNLTDDAQKKVL